MGAAVDPEVNCRIARRSGSSGGRVHAAAPRARALTHQLVEQHDRRARRSGIEERRELGVDDDERGVGVGDAHVGLLDELLDRPQAHRQRQRDHRAAGEERRLDRGHQRAGRRPEDADVNAGADAACLQRGGDPAGVVVQASPLDPVGGAGGSGPAADPTKVTVPALSAAVSRRETTEGIMRWTRAGRRGLLAGSAPRVPIGDALDGRTGRGLEVAAGVYATGISATWLMLSGMPRSSAASASWARWRVVQAEPRPRDRRASMKLHTAGRIDP